MRPLQSSPENLKRIGQAGDFIFSNKKKEHKKWNPLYSSRDSALFLGPVKKPAKAIQAKLNSLQLQTTPPRLEKKLAVQT